MTDREALQAYLTVVHELSSELTDRAVALAEEHGLNAEMLLQDVGQRVMALSQYFMRQRYVEEQRRKSS